MVKISFAEGLERAVTLIDETRQSIAIPVIAVAGASQAGKTYFTNKLKEKLAGLNVRVIVLAMDNYFCTKAELSTATAVSGSACNYNFDDPSAVLLSRLHDDIAELKEGRPVQRLEYTYTKDLNTGFPTAERKIHGFIHTCQGDVVIVEGLFVHHPAIRSVTDVGIFIDQPDEQRRLEQRVRRDTTRRHFSESEVIKRWRQFVEPAMQNHIRPPDFTTRFQVELWIDNRY